AINTWWNDRIIKFNYDDQLGILRRLGFDSPRAEQLAWGFGVGLIGWMLWIAWQVGRGERAIRPDALARAYLALCRKLSRAGVPRPAHQGPLAFAAEVSARRPDLATQISSLLQRYAELRFGRAEAQSHREHIRDFEREVRRLKVRARA